jgi:hypothetical protein
VNLPLLEIEYVKISRHGGPSDPSSFDETNRFRSVQTWRPPVVAQLEELLEKFVPFGEVSAATGPTTSSRTNGTARNAIPNRRTGHLLTQRRTRQAGDPALDRSVGRRRYSRGVSLVSRCKARVSS